MNRVITVDGRPVALILEEKIYLPPITMVKGANRRTDPEFDLGIFAPYFSALTEEYIMKIPFPPSAELFFSYFGTIDQNSLKLPNLVVRNVGEFNLEHHGKERTNLIRANIEGSNFFLLAFPDTELVGDFTLNMIYPLLSNIFRIEAGLPLLEFILPPDEMLAFGFENIWHGFITEDKTYLPNSIINSMCLESKDLITGFDTSVVLKPAVEYSFEEIGFSRENFGALWHNCVLDRKPLSLLYFSGKIVGLAWVNEEEKKISFPEIWVRKVPVAKMILCSQELGLQPQFNINSLFEPYHSFIYGKFEGKWLRNAVMMKNYAFEGIRDNPSFTIEPRSIYGSELIFYRNFGFKEYREEPTQTTFSNTLYRCENGLLNHALFQGTLPIGASISLIKKEEMMSYFPKDCPLELIEMMLEFFCDAFIDELDLWLENLDVVGLDLTPFLADKPIKEQIFAALFSSTNQKAMFAALRNSW
jgi:hypothetical protein